MLSRQFGKGGFMNHKTISFIKSGLRILAFGSIAALTASPIILIAFSVLVLAEILGVIEELVPAPPIKDILK
jgi:hypothetical protein